MDRNAPADLLQVCPAHDSNAVGNEEWMAVFADAEQLYQVLGQVFDRLAEDPAQLDSFTQSNLVIRLRLNTPDAELLLDGRQPPLEVFYGPSPGEANLEFSMDADLLHAIWSGRESTSQAFFSGRIKSKGNLARASHMVDLFRAAERIYPEIAAAYDLA
jgi:hypothetical protein